MGLATPITGPLGTDYSHGGCWSGVAERDVVDKEQRFTDCSMASPIAFFTGFHISTDLRSGDYL